MTIQAQISGKVVGTPVTKQAGPDHTVTEFTVRSWKNGVTTFVKVEAWNGLGGIASKLVDKQHVSIAARLKGQVTESENGKISRPRAWVTDGEARSQWEFTAESIDF